MVHQDRIIEAFASNQIKRVLLIDDAYDPPELHDSLGSIVDFLESETGRMACQRAGISDEIVAAAATAANGNDTKSAELKTVIERLYASFRANDEDRAFDPDGIFRLNKEPALAALRPLYKLLGYCSTVQTSGFQCAIKQYQEFDPQVIFLDYYLGPDVPESGDADENSKTITRGASLNVLRQIVNAPHRTALPAVVLISSQHISDVDEYRVEAKSGILALRFGFLQKNMVRQRGKEIEIDLPAVDVLLDVTQGYLFGKELQGVLTQWRDGAERALDEFIKEIGDLHTKDFAYLMRFRLREEGITLNEYLGWLFGECLKGWVEEKIDWNTLFSNLDDTKCIEENIEGAFEGPSKITAELFHRVRVSSHRLDECQRYRLGDLFVRDQEGNIRAVITPDCDLVPRKNKIKAKSVLTMGGTLCTFDDEDAAADDLFVYEKKPFSVQWNPKDLKTFPVDGEGSLHKTYKLLGTLRPLYAQAMQRRALVDLSRIGLPAAPAFGINASVTVWIRKNDGIKEIEIGPPAVATLIPSRSGQSVGHRVLLRRRFVRELIVHLKQIRQEDMCCNDKQLLRDAIKKDGDELYNRCLRSGGLTNDKNIFGIGYSLDSKPSQKQSAPWLQIVLKVSDEQMEELSTVDPLE